MEVLDINLTEHLLHALEVLGRSPHTPCILESPHFAQSVQRIPGTASDIKLRPFERPSNSESSHHSILYAVRS